MFFTIEKIEKQLQEIRLAIHRGVIEIPVFKFAEGLEKGAEAGVHCPEYDDLHWADFRVGETWGGYDVVAWFRAWVDAPPEWMGKKLALRFLVGPRDGGNSTAEALLYVNGEPLQAIDVWHEEAWLPPEMTASGRLLVALKAWSGVMGVPERRRFKLAQLVWRDQGAEEYYYLAHALLESIKLLDENDLRRVKLLETLNRSLQCIDYLRPRSQAFYQSIAAAARFLEDGLERLQAAEIKPRVTAVGHSHIDMAWLWRLSHTREKAARTFSTVLHLMRQYPEYHYMHSSPQLYKYLKEDYPDIYLQVKERVAAGRWEVTGGMWVEADTNLTSGESLIRQFLLGKRFMREEFGVESSILWLPDVFGYSAALPQIAVKSGMKYFLTSKISWSQFNRFPYDTFRWRGLDGTEILTHFVTTPDAGAWFYTYNGRLNPAEVKGIWDNYRQKNANDELLLLFGWGDGGGGPTMEMLESARALKNVPGMPAVEVGASEPYFARLEQRLSGQQLPVWDGELYLEYHRGTYTSQAHIKRANRMSEILYHDAEWLSALDSVSVGKEPYPAGELRQGWELILLNQFHDILPGSSIRQVYEDSRKDYRVIQAIGDRAVNRARKSLLEHIRAGGRSLVVFNSLSFDRDGLVEIPAGGGNVETLVNEAGDALPFQLVESNGERKALLGAPSSPGLGYAAYPLVSTAPETAGPGGMTITTTYLENDMYQVRLNERGQITSIYDKRYDCEALSPGGRGNVLQAFEDKPMNFDAWDIDIYYQEKMREVDELLEAVVEESGPLRGSLRLVWRYGDSRITQRLTLYRRSPRIDFRTHIDWRESQVLLKAAFPVAVRATRATYDIQFGNVERPTHWNTSWDYARFETAGHKWVDLSEGGYGVALLNDCKYGHDVKDNLMRLTLLKSAIEPDETADRGEHVFTYSLLPHEGDWRQGQVVKEAYALNYPLRVGLIRDAQEGSLPPAGQFARVDAGHVLIETIKKAEEGEAWVVRVYEYQQRRSKQVSLSFNRPICRAVECNLVEEEEREVEFSGSGLLFGITPYEIKTFKVWFV